MKIDLKYNPYLIETQLYIDGRNVTESGDFPKLKGFIDQQLPLQNWLDPIEYLGWKGFVAELKDKVGEGESEFIIHFTGRKLDFIDLEASITQQADEFDQFQYITDFVYDDDKTAQELDNAVKILLSDTFRNMIESDRYKHRLSSAFPEMYNGLKEAYEQTKKKEFRIVFAGTYSSGKSTILNALLGKKIFPMADGACTSKQFCIVHKEVPFVEMRCLDKDGKEIIPLQEYVNEKDLQDKFYEIFPPSYEQDEDGKNVILPSVPPGIDQVQVFTDLSDLYPDGFKDKFNLVLMDTPGTDDGWSKERLEIAMSAITSPDKEMVVLVTDAGKDQNKNILELLDLIDESNEADNGMYNQRFLFVMNKCDCTSYERHESLPKKLVAFQDFIRRKPTTDNSSQNQRERSIKAPRIFPTAALPALAVRKGWLDSGSVEDDVEEQLAQAYENFLKKTKGKFSSANSRLDTYSVVSAAIKQKINKKLETADEPTQVFIHTGIPSLQEAIKAYIERYAYPLKVQKAYRIFCALLTETNMLNAYILRKFQEVSDEIAEGESKEVQKKIERSMEETRKEVLDDARETVNECVSELSRVFFDGGKIAALKADIEKEYFNKALGLFTAKKSFTTKVEAQKQQREIVELMQDGIEECNNWARKIICEQKQLLQNIIGRAESCLNSLKQSGVFEIDGFDFTVTASFSILNDEEILKSMLETSIRAGRVTREVPNPVKKQKLKWWQFGKRLDRWLAPDTIQESFDEFYLSDDLKKHLGDLDGDLIEFCDQLYQDGRNEVETQKQTAKMRLTAIMNEMYATEQRLKDTQNAIYELAKNNEEFVRIKNEYMDDSNILSRIQNELSPIID